MPNQPVSISIADELRIYIDRCVDLGAFTGDNGQEDFSTDLQPLISAIHTVLAGGAVTVDVVDQGDTTIVAELNQKLADAKTAANDINSSNGSRLVIIG